METRPAPHNQGFSLPDDPVPQEPAMPGRDVGDGKSGEGAKANDADGDAMSDGDAGGGDAASEFGEPAPAAAAPAPSPDPKPVGGIISSGQKSTPESECKKLKTVAQRNNCLERLKRDQK